MKNLTDPTNYIFYSCWICFAVLNFASTSEQTNNEIVHWRVGLWTRWTQPPMNEKTTATTTTTKVQNINTLHLVKIVPALCHGIDNSTIYCNLIRIHMLLWLRKKMYMYSLLLLGYCCSAIGGCEYSYICIYICVLLSPIVCQPCNDFRLNCLSLCHSKHKYQILFYYDVNKCSAFFCFFASLQSASDISCAVFQVV